MKQYVPLKRNARIWTSLFLHNYTYLQILIIYLHLAWIDKVGNWEKYRWIGAALNDRTINYKSIIKGVLRSIQRKLMFPNQLEDL